MTSTLNRPTQTTPALDHVHDAVPTRPAPWRARMRSHRATLCWLLPLIAVAVAVQAWNMFGAPQRVDDEGTYMAQAYAVQHWGELGHYTYWYDHPPLGWLQLSLWTTVADVFHTPGDAVAQGRVAMLVVQAVCVCLVWLLGRRLGLSRLTAAAAVLVFSLSPLALYFHRMVYLDNIATMSVLAAFTLATARQHQLAAFNGVAACFAVAVLTKETSVLWLPALAWLMWRSAHPAIRRYTLTLSAALFGLLTSGYLVYAVLKTELVPGPHRVSLIGGVLYQLVNRNSSGALWDPNSAARETVDAWIGLDPVLPVMALIAAIPVFVLQARWRPIVVAFLLPVLMMLRPGYLPIPYVIAILPFAALVAAAGLELTLRRRWTTPIAALAAVGAVVAASQTWGSGYGLLLRSDQDWAMAQAEDWLATHATKTDRMLVDDAAWVDLVREGFPRENVVWYFKADTDPAVQALAPDGWRDYQYLMVTESVRGTVALAAGGQPSPYGEVTQAYQHSTVVASFGSGDQEVEIRRIGEQLTPPRSAAAPTRPHRPSPREQPAVRGRTIPTPSSGTSATAVAPAPVPTPTTAPSRPARPTRTYRRPPAPHPDGLTELFAFLGGVLGG